MAQSSEPLHLPVSLQAQLHAYRRRVWTIKMAEAIGVAIFATIVAFLCVFAMDRLGDTPRWLRMGIFLGALGACTMVPLYLHRWIWRRRHLEQLARLLSVKLPHLGDELLGIVELVHSVDEQTRSRALCVAAIDQVASSAGTRNLTDATPDSRHRLWGILAAAGIVAAIALALSWPTAFTNAWARMLAPWAATPRYTFATIEPLPAEMIVAHGEPFRVTIKLSPQALWHPAEGQVCIGRQKPIVTVLEDGRYEFDMPSQIAEGTMYVRIGDARQTVRIKPLLRPELTSIVADVTLPKYLGRNRTVNKDARGGSVSLVKGSRASFIATASRPLSEANVDGQPLKPSDDTIRSPEILIEEKREVEFDWKDQYALAGKEPFRLKVAAVDDEAPTLACEDLPRVKVVLDSEHLLFGVKAQDDFGVKQIGMEWETPEGALVEKPIHGERILVAGGNDKTMVTGRATVWAKSLGIAPQPIFLRAYAEDYFPGRKRVYSAVALLYILDPEQHAIWLSNQLHHWHNQARQVHDREKYLHAINDELRNLSPEEIDQPNNRRRIERQASAERANGRRLSHLVVTGEDLIRQASRNPEFGIGDLERWAEMLQILKDIAANRMPSVSDLLQDAAEAKPASSSKPCNAGPKAGNVRTVKPGSSSKNGSDDQQKPKPKVPGINDIESSQQPPDKNNDENKPGNSKCNPSLRLPTTKLAGGGPKKQNDKPKPPAGEKMDEAVQQQEDLLAEFEKVINELNNILANLEGSTLVKRLKAASREQYRLAGRIGEQLDETFGLPESSLKKNTKQIFDDLSLAETKSSYNVSYIMDDMQAYFERRRFIRFKDVLEDMKKQDVIGGLRQLGEDVAGEPGMSIAQCEYWSDAMDRWAEDLVDVCKCGQCCCSKSAASLPPSIVLEVLQILEGEMNLREDTRVVQQAKPALKKDEYHDRAKQLSETQNDLRDRTMKVIDRILELPNAEQQFAKEVRLLSMVSEVMAEATDILAEPETGSPAIGAETEIIELLLQSRRFNPKGGGGGGASPGGGGGGTTSDSALALLGKGVNEKEKRNDRAASQSTGETGRSLPEEFRTGLDNYFHRLEEPNRR